MEITSNYSIINLFANNKVVKIFCGKDIIKLNLQSIGAFYNDEEWATCYTITTNEEKREALLPKLEHSPESLEEIKTLIFKYGQYAQYNKIIMMVRNKLSVLIEGLEFNFQTKELIANGVIITPDIWNYIVYILKLSCGEKESKPITFENESARQVYLAQKQFEKQIHNIKSNSANGDNEQLLKIMLTIVYQFPSFTMDYLFNQTMAQIHWLYNYAAKSVSYEITADAFAAGNLKKGKNPDFFIK